MNRDVEELLREGMERFTKDLRAPAGLTRRVARRRRRRLVVRSTAGTAAALAAAVVALVAIVVPGAHDNGADATAYVVKRVDGALSAAEPGAIAQVTVTTRSAVTPDGPAATTTAEEWSYGSEWRSVANSPYGGPVYDEGSGPASVLTLVSYVARTWARQHEQAHPSAQGSPLAAGGPLAQANPSGQGGAQAGAHLGPGGCEPVVDALPLLFQPGLPGMHFTSPAAVARGLRVAISCGALKAVPGRQRVDGIEAIELTSLPGVPAAETVWVSPGTYLPVRVVVRSQGAHHGLLIDNHLILQMTADIKWLSPTGQNLAKLTVPIPAGFRHVPLGQAVWPILQQPAGGFSAYPPTPGPLRGGSG